MHDHDQDRWVEIGEIVRPHGLHGEVRVKLFNAESKVLLDLDSVQLLLPSGAERSIEILNSRVAAEGFVLMLLSEVANRDSAEVLRGARLRVHRSQLPPPEEGEFYVCDILGAEVTLVDGTPVGKVIDFKSYPTADVIVIQDGDKQHEVPLIEDFIASVEPDKHRVVLHELVAEL